jgi:hypothetical protein
VLLFVLRYFGGSLLTQEGTKNKIQAQLVATGSSKLP